MKRLFTAFALLLTFTLSISAMSYEQARNQALFLTDKMAYELNLTDQQYEAAYEINLDYLMRIDNADDLYGAYWRQRDLDLSYILLDWQYRAYVNASYFYRPLYWNGGYWHFGIDAQRRTLMVSRTPLERSARRRPSPRNETQLGQRTLRRRVCLPARTTHMGTATRLQA